MGNSEFGDVGMGEVATEKNGISYFGNGECCDRENWISFYFGSRGGGGGERCVE